MDIIGIILTILILGLLEILIGMMVKDYEKIIKQKEQIIIELQIENNNLKRRSENEVIHQTI